VTWQGCCDGQRVRYCVNGQLKHEDCNKKPLCGWKVSGAYAFYGCGTTGSADPSGKLPKTCGADAGAKQDASGCGPVTEKGCCLGNRLYYCAAGALRTMDCGKSPSCGWLAAAEYYDCATSGEADPTGTYPRTCGFDGGPPRLDAGPVADRSILDGGPSLVPGGSGCGCEVGRRRPRGELALLLLLLLLGVVPRRGS
jgi:hypothetical protein